MAENLHRVSVEQRSTLSEQAKNIVKEQFDSLLSSPAHDLSGKYAQGEVITNDSECD